MNKFIFKNLPKDIIHYIFEYSGKIYYFKKKYICKLEMHNYSNINKIPRPIKTLPNSYNLYLINKRENKGYILRYILIPNDIIRLSVLFCRDFLMSSEYYIFPKNSSKWRRVISYDNLSKNT